MFLVCGYVGNVVVGGLNNFIFFNAYFLSVNVFQGEGGCEVLLSLG